MFFNLEKQMFVNLIKKIACNIEFGFLKQLGSTWESSINLITDSLSAVNFQEIENMVLYIIIRVN